MVVVYIYPVPHISFSHTKGKNAAKTKGEKAGIPKGKNKETKTRGLPSILKKSVCTNNNVSIQLSDKRIYTCYFCYRIMEGGTHPYQKDPLEVLMVLFLIHTPLLPFFFY
jgi:hypothetical protein